MNSFGLRLVKSGTLHTDDFRSADPSEICVHFGVEEFRENIETLKRLGQLRSS